MRNSRVLGWRLLIILSSRRRWLGSRCRHRLWGPPGAPRLFEGCEELLYLTGLLESIVDRLHDHCTVKMKSDKPSVGSHSQEERVQAVQEGVEQAVSTRGS